MKTKPVYVYWCYTGIPGVMTICDAHATQREAARRRRYDIDAGCPVGPIVRVAVPLPEEKGRRG